jgi:phosphoribosylanthranilate isomerase
VARPICYHARFFLLPANRSSLYCMHRTRVKICGITRSEDALGAVAAGADAIGLVFYSASPRAVSVEQAAAICATLGPLVAAVGLFVDAVPEQVHAVLQRVPLTLLQFHGDESPAYCAQFQRPYLKAVRMRGDVDIAAALARYPQAQGLLLDTYRAGVPGGTGEAFDWRRVPPAIAPRIVLAGGLNPANVTAAIRQARPGGVDVSGGVESAPGIKDNARIEAFLAAVRRADETEHGSD